MLAQSNPATSPQTTIGDVVSAEQGGRVEIQVPMEGPAVRPRWSRLTDPDRAVFDFSGTKLKGDLKKVKVDRATIVSVRTAPFGTDRLGRPVTRVVIDLSKPTDFEMRSENGKFVVSFEKVGGTSSVAATAAATTSVPPKLVPPAKPSARVEPPVAATVNKPVTPKVEAKVEAKAEPKVAAKNETKNDPGPKPRVEPTISAPVSGALQLQDIYVEQKGGSTSIALRFNQEPKPRVSHLSDPKRLVMDFPGAVFGAGWNKPAVMKLQSGAVTSVRSAMFKDDPPVLRVVFDEIENASKADPVTDGNTVSLQFSDGLSGGTPAVLAKAVPVPAPKVAQLPPPESHPKPRVVAQHTIMPRPQPMAAAQNPAPAPTPAVEPSGIQPHAPIVSYADGLLSVDAENSNLTDVLFAISEKTGAGIELPMSEGMLDRVVIRMGPGRPREILAALLEGSTYNYVISENPSGALDKVVLQPKEMAPPPPAISGN